jgi:hypothetical protein
VSPPVAERRRGEQVASGLLGLAGGLGTNTLSNDVGYRGAAVAAGLAALLYTLLWLRRLPARSLLGRFSSAAFMILAAAGLIGALFVAADWTGGVVLASASLTLAAVCLYRDRPARLRALSTCAGVAVGIPVAAWAVPIAQGGHVVLAVGVVAIGAACVCFGLSTAYAGVGVTLTAHLLMGLGATIAGAAFLTDGVLLLGLVTIGFGVTVAGVGLAWYWRSRTAYMVGGMVGSAFAFVALPLPAGLVLAGLVGLAGVAFWRGRDFLAEVVIMGGVGAVMLVVGIVRGLGGDGLLTLSWFGMAAAGAGCLGWAILAAGIPGRVQVLRRRWWQRLTEDRANFS